MVVPFIGGAVSRDVRIHMTYSAIRIPTNFNGLIRHGFKLDVWKNKDILVALSTTTNIAIEVCYSKFDICLSFLLIYNLTHFNK